MTLWLVETGLGSDEVVEVPEEPLNWGWVKGSRQIFAPDWMIDSAMEQKVADYTLFGEWVERREGLAFDDDGDEVACDSFHLVRLYDVVLAQEGEIA